MDTNELKQRRPATNGYHTDESNHINEETHPLIDGNAKELVKDELDSGEVWGKNKSVKATQPKSSFAFIDNNFDTIFLYVLTFLSFFTRYYNIGWSNKVVWDEAHFGKFGSHYLKREFYFDVHPPLGKILVGVSGALARYNGSFEFKSGEAYPADVNYSVMRLFCATWGALMVPLAYMTAKELQFSRWARVATGLAVLCDNAYLVISRFILLDSMLLFFTVLVVYFWTRFHNERQYPFTFEWWYWLTYLGISLGLVSSVKWVGLFAVALVGLYTLENLWDLFGDLSIPKRAYAQHWIARIICLILVPISVYVFSFALHFTILSRSGPGDAQMSSLFQANLEGTNLKNSPLELAYESKFTLKNNGYGGGLLHSHVQTYPHGSKQQQVTCYHHKDSNNDWIIRKPWVIVNGTINYEDSAGNDTESKPVEFVKHGDVVRLVHAQTGRNLHSHPLAAPITKTMNEVSGYGNTTIGDENDHWLVEVIDDIVTGSTDRIKTLTTRVRLRHKLSGCLLRSHNVILPQWGFKQAEVACDKRNRVNDVYNIWNIESHWNDRLPKASPGAFKSKFWHNFIHLNVAMWTSNNALVPDPDKEPDGLTSSPWDWPLMQAGIRMCSWGDNDVKFYMIGNPIVWWLGTASLAGFVLIWAVYMARWQRKYKNWNAADWNYFTFTGKYLLLGWALHYIPFHLMGRVTYVHHYFPALYFAILSTAFLLDHVTKFFCRAVVLKVFVWSLYVGSVVAVFGFFAPLSFGFDVPNRELRNRKWLSSWNLAD